MRVAKEQIQLGEIPEERPSGAEARVALMDRLRHGAGAEKLVGVSENRSSGAEAQPIVLTSSARLKPCPCYKAPSVDFFRKQGSRALIQDSLAQAFFTEL
jgi:hypothetical protein